MFKINNTGYNKFEGRDTPLGRHYLNNKETEKLIESVYHSLDYTLSLEDRLALTETLTDSLFQLNDRYEYYYSKCRNDYPSYNWAKKISKCMDSVSNYLLFASEVTDDYTYSLEDNFTMLEKHKYRPIANKDKLDNSRYKKTKKTISEYLQDGNIPKYIYDYIDFAEATRHTIKQVEEQCKQLKEPIANNHIFFYKTIKGKDHSITYEDYKRLRKATGYTKNNSIKLDKEILYMLNNHFEPMKSSNSVKNMWTDIVGELDSDIGLDIDLLDRENISLLLKGICYYGESEVFDIYFKQIAELVNNCKLTELQKQIYELLREGQEGTNSLKISLGAIAEKLGKSRSQIHSSFDMMVNKIYEAYEKVYEDNYYTYIAKGKYKVCSKCGRILLATENYFYVDNTKADGLRNYCKDCSSRQNIGT